MQDSGLTSILHLIFQIYTHYRQNNAWEVLNIFIFESSYHFVLSWLKQVILAHEMTDAD